MELAPESVVAKARQAGVFAALLMRSCLRREVEGDARLRGMLGRAVVRCMAEGGL